jgi:DNA ligase-1
MPDLADGESAEVKGSGAKPWIVRNTGGVYSCNCPAWRNQSVPIERRSCKHIRALRGAAAEAARIGSEDVAAATPKPASRGKLAAQKDAASPAAEPSAAEKAPPLLLAHAWDNQTPLDGWWMSEKLDGVRAYWDGEQFLSRQGNRFHAPEWFRQSLPASPLDGELWIGRGAFQRTVSVVRRHDETDLWKEVSYLVFDAPAVAEPFEQRQKFLRSLLRGSRKVPVRALEHQRCKSIEHVREELQRIESLGGEGLMLRQPGSHYEAGRSHTLLKVKSFLDAEARVVGHQAGTGKHKGRLGALLVEMPGGEQFAIGTGMSDAERENPPPIGSLVTYRYQELTDRGVPRFPSFLRVRTDVGS